MIIPSAARPLLETFSPAFTRPTYRRFLVLLFAAVLTVGRRTVSNLLRTIGASAPGHPSSYHRVLSRRKWSLWPLGRALAGFILDRFVPDGTVRLVADDTVESHPGKKVFGKGRHRDPVRSSRTYTTWRWGHKWVVLSILVKFPFAKRPWALPVLVWLYRCPPSDGKKEKPKDTKKSKDTKKKRGSKTKAAGPAHKTPADILAKLVRILMLWFPERRFVLAGDAGYASHRMARFAKAHRSRLTLVSRFVPDAVLHEPAPPPPPPEGRKPKGRPRGKGARLPSPEQVVAGSPRTPLTVSWYGGQERKVEVVTGVGHWHRSGEGLVEVRWVYVHDLSGTHRDDWFYSTDPTMSARAVLETFTGRWSTETTFQECRAYLGLETTRGRVEKTVQRSAPCLFGLFSVVSLLFADLPAGREARVSVEWAGKREPTFSDAMTAVRRVLWEEWIFANPEHASAFSKLPEPLLTLLFHALVPAA